MDTAGKIKRIVADIIDCDIKDIGDNTRIIDDLGADSLDIIMIIDKLEREFNVEFTNTAYSSMMGNSVNAVADQIELLLNK